MNAIAAYTIVLVAGYLYGAIPWGLIVGKTTSGVDVRQYGSGNIGFANFQRVAGLRLGVLVLLGDFSKGVLPIVLARLLRDDAYLEAAGAMAGLAGHTWPVYLRFKGGKGVATTAGAFLTMAPLAMIAVGAIGVLLAALTRYVSLPVLIVAPILTALMLALAIADLTQWAYVLFAAGATAVIYYRHRENIARLRAGTESKLGQRAERAAP